MEGELTGGCVGRQVEDLGEDDLAVVLRRVAAVMHGAVEVKGEHRRGLIGVSVVCDQQN